MVVVVVVVPMVAAAAAVVVVVVVVVDDGDRVDKYRTPNLGRGFAKSVKFRFKLLRHG